jgi:hypothetical protein
VTAGAPNAGIVLPEALPGKIMLINNNSANNITVFADAGSVINGVPGAIGIIQTGNTAVMFVATAVDYWTVFPFATNSSVALVTKYQFVSALLQMAPPVDPDLLYQAIPAAWDNATTIQFNTSAYVGTSSPVYALTQTVYGYSGAQMAILMGIAASLPQWG